METFKIIQLIAVPLVAAATGYLTNYIAVRMLFRPRTEQRIFGFRLQGLIPRRRPQIAESVALTVEQHLISHDDIRAALRDPVVEERTRDFLDQRVSRLLAEKLPGIHPMVGMFVNDQLIEKLKGLIMGEILDAIGPLTEQVMDTLEEKLDFRQIVVQKIENFDLGTFEDIVLRIAARELRAIEILGGALGFLIGLMTDLLLL